MAKIIEVPGHGQVEFPDNMTDDQIVAAIKRNSAPAQAAPNTGMMSFNSANKAIAAMPDSILNTPNHILNLGKAAIGAGYQAVTGKTAPNALLPSEDPNLTRKLFDKLGFTKDRLEPQTAGQRVLDNTIQGGVAGAMSPASGARQVAANMLLGGASGAAAGGTKEASGDDNLALAAGIMAAPAGAAAAGTAQRAAKVLRAGLVDPFTENGRTRIVGGLVRRSAADADAAASNMLSRSGTTPGFNPTAGQASGDAGVASLERTARAIDPAGFGGVDQSQRSSLIEALRSVAKTPEEKAAAVAAREAAVKPLYAAAKSAVVDGDSTIDALLKRPSMSAASGRAAKLAAERGDKFAISAGAPEQTVSTGLLDAQGNPLQQTAPATPSRLGGAALHDLKMGLDDAIGNPGLGGMQGAERNAALGTKEEFLKWVEQKIPEYAQAKSTYADMSRPINQMDIGQELYNRFIPPLADGAAVPFRATADAYARALNRNGDKLAANVTGMNGVKLKSIMEPEQMDLLRGVVSDSQMKAAAENIGRGVGSDTVQKMATSNLIGQSGLPSWITSFAPLRPLGGMLKTAGDILYSKSDETMRHLLADMLKDPARTAAAMKQAPVPPAKYADLLRAAAQVSAMNAAEQTANQNP